MNMFGSWHQQVDLPVPAIKDFCQTANDICERALNDAKQELHPLLRETEIYQLRKRNKFVAAFKLALEQRIARRIATRYPDVQAVFKFDESWTEARRRWDGSLHLLVKIPHLSDSLKTFGKKLDESLTQRLQKLGWSRFREHSSILEIQQVTSNEMRHGIGYGAMFYAVYSVPVKVWSPKR